MNKLYITLALLMTSATMFGVSNIVKFVNKQRTGTGTGESIPVLVVNEETPRDSRVLRDGDLSSALWIPWTDNKLYIATKAGLFTLSDQNWKVYAKQLPYYTYQFATGGIQQGRLELTSAGGDFILTVLADGTLSLTKQ